MWANHHQQFISCSGWLHLLQASNILDISNFPGKKSKKKSISETSSLFILDISDKRKKNLKKEDDQKKNHRRSPPRHKRVLLYLPDVYISPVYIRDRCRGWPLHLLFYFISPNQRTTPAAKGWKRYLFFYRADDLSPPSSTGSPSFVSHTHPAAAAAAEGSTTFSSFSLHSLG